MFLFLFQTIKHLESQGFLRCPADAEEEQAGPQPARQKGGSKKKENKENAKGGIRSRLRRDSAKSTRDRRAAKNRSAGHSQFFNSVGEDRFLGYVNGAESNVSPL